MGATGAIIMGFFGAVFAAMALAGPLGHRGAVLTVPFLVFVAIAMLAWRRLRRPQQQRPARSDRVILWSTIGEGAGIFLAVNVAVNLGHAEWTLPAIALIVGLHFLPMGWGVPFAPFYALGAALLVVAAVGFAVPAPIGPAISGLAAALCLWAASTAALRRA